MRSGDTPFRISFSCPHTVLFTFYLHYDPAGHEQGVRIWPFFQYHMKPKAWNIGDEDTSKPGKRSQTRSSLQSSRSTKEPRRGSANYQKEEVSIPVMNGTLDNSERRRAMHSYRGGT